MDQQVGPASRTPDSTVAGRSARTPPSTTTAVVDGQLVDRPSFRVKPGQMIHVKERSESTPLFQDSAIGVHRDVLPAVPDYLDVKLDKLQARLVRRPKRAEVPVTCEVQLVVEYYAAR